MSMLAQAARGIKNIWSHGDDDYENEEDDAFDEGHAPAASHSSKFSDHKFSSTSNYAPSHGGGHSNANRAKSLRTVPIPLRAREKNIYTLRPKNLDEAAIAADYLKAGSAVVVNLESVEPSSSIRIIDFMSGVCYGLENQGHAMKLGDSIFLFTPGEFEISSDELDYGENRDFLFKDVAGAPAMSKAAQQAISPASGGNAYTSSFANSYNTPQHGAQGMTAQSATLPSSQIPSAAVAQAAQTQAAPRAQTLPASSVYGTSGKAHVTVGGRPAPINALTPQRPSNVTRSWER